MRARLRWLTFVVLMAAFCVDVQFGWGGGFVTNLVDDVSELVAALLATACGFWRARTCLSRMRWSWALVASGCGCWAVGQALWTYYEVVLERQVPFPGIDDVGFLAFPILALTGLLTRPANGLGHRGRVRMLLDGVLVASSLFVITWVTAFGHVLAAGANSTFSLGVSLSYPVGDLLLLTATLVVVSHTPPSRRFGLGVLAAGFALLSLADSSFAYLTASGTFGNGNFVDGGWVAGFVLVAVAARRDQPGGEPSSARTALSAHALLLPYVPGVLGLAITIYQVRGNHQDDVSLSSAALIMFALMVRQLLVLRDNRELTATATRQAYHDGLTGLANRTLFANRLAHALDLHQRNLRAVAVLFLDLDDFKIVNDSLGHAAGDQLLIQVGQRLRAAVRPGDTLARLGGDEFAVLIEDGGNPAALAERLRRVLQEPVSLSGVQRLVHASIGYAVASADLATPSSDQLMAEADIAMYQAKRRGKNEICQFRPGMAHEAAPDQHLAPALAQAIKSGAIRVVYQPIVDLRSGEIAGFEALARWRCEGRDVPPTVFIPIAEKHELISALTDHVLETACRQLSIWSEYRGNDGLHVAVNIPSALLADLGFAARVAAVLARHRLTNRGQLTLEITETSLVANPDVARRVCAQLTAIGVCLSLDDFGTGYSSLTQLQTIPLDTLKIDRSFVTKVCSDTSSQQLLKGIVLLAHTLGLRVIAEGVETPEQVSLLHDFGCEYAQGFLFAAPQDADTVPLALPALTTTPR